MFLHTVTALARAVEIRDQYTGNHTQRVTEYSFMLAQRMDLPADQLNWIRLGTPLHDIGKIGIDDKILKKEGKLTNEEFEIMKTHTTIGAKLLEQVPDLAPVIPITRSHHERWDGKGYPDRLGGEQIPLLARIVAVADAFDAITTKRCYKDPMPPEAAFAEIEKCKGKQFDPIAANAFLAIRSQIVQAMHAETRKIMIEPSFRLAI